MSVVEGRVPIIVAAVSHRGAVRDVNEDALGFASWTLSSSEGGPLRVALLLDGSMEFMVADGLGGHRGGTEASRMAVEAIGSGTGELSARIAAASDAVYERGVHDPALRGMGTTLAGVRVEPSGHATVFNVGDSRVYRIADGYLGLLSVDDRPVDRSADDHGIVTQVLGGAQRTAVDVHESSVMLAAGDRLMLCTDGLSDVLDDDAISELAAASARPEIAAQALLDAALVEGAPDNVTVVIIDFGGADAG